MSKALQKIKDFFYEIQVKLYHKLGRGKKKSSLKNRSVKDLIFCLVILAYPTIQFCLFYLGVNFNSVFLAFKRYTGKNNYVFANFDNFIKVFKDFGRLEYLQDSIKNSAILYVVSFVFGVVLSLLFAFFIYKKIRGYKFYRIMLFLPSVISPIVMALIFRYFVDKAVPAAVLQIFHVEIQGLLANANSKLFVLLFFSVWVSFGVSMLMYSGAMSGINDAIIEAAKLDGVNQMKEFIYIVVPMIYPTIVTFIVVGIAGLFTNQMNLYSFYGDNADYNYYTLGYFIYNRSKVAPLEEFPYLSAMGLCMSVVAVPLTLITKKLLEKFGPNAY